MKSISSKALALCALFGCAASAYAIPTLQVGAPAGSGDVGLYADYKPTLSSPTESDTAVTSGNQILVGGAYSRGATELLIGGQYSGSAGTGLNWAQVLKAKFGGSLSDYAAFNGKGAILLASVPNGAAGSLAVNGASAFFTSSTKSLFPNLHDPVKPDISDFLFFDIGNFAKTGTVPNFADETGGDVGQIKSLIIATSGFQWVHFDVMALVTTKKKGGGTTTGLLTGLDNNPGSHDVTWKDSGGPPFGTPEPATPLLLGLGLMGLLMARRARSK